MVSIGSLVSSSLYLSLHTFFWYLHVSPVVSSLYSLFSLLQSFSLYVPFFVFACISSGLHSLVSLLQFLSFSTYLFFVFACISSGLHSLYSLFSLLQSLSVSTYLFFVFACISSGLHSLFSVLQSLSVSPCTFVLILHVSPVVSTVSLVSSSLFLPLHALLY